MQRLTLIAGLLLALPATGAVIISNYPQSVGSTTGNFADTQNLATGFQMPNGANYSLTSATLQLRIDSGVTNVTLALYGGSTTLPSGSALVTFVNPALDPTPSDGAPFVFTPSSPFTLNANSNYWLVLTGDSPGSGFFTWRGSSPAVTPTGLATFLGQTDGADLPPIGAVTPASFRFTYQIDGEIVNESGVPEPISMSLAGAGLAAIWLLRRR